MAGSCARVAGAAERRDRDPDQLVVPGAEVGWSRPSAGAGAPAARLRARCRRSATSAPEVLGAVVGVEVEHDAALATCCSATTRGCARGPARRRRTGRRRGCGGRRAARPRSRRRRGRRAASRRRRRARSRARRRGGLSSAPLIRSRHAVLGQLLDLRRRRGRGSPTAPGRCARRGTGRRARSTSRSPRGGRGGRRRARRPSRGGAPSATAPTRWCRGRGRCALRAGRPATRGHAGGAERLGRARTGRASRSTRRGVASSSSWRREPAGQRLVAGVGGPRLVDHRREAAQSASSRHAIAIQSSSPSAG